MQLCLQEAIKGFGHVSPNPMVGCVIVHNDRIIAKSHHKLFGGPHAEVNAINQIDSHDILKESTVYVSLEPCAHHGKTPPCANLLIDKKVKRVVIAMQDPFAAVSGRGIQMLKDAGIEVTLGVLESEAKELNKRFITNHTHHRPYVILKWAESKDGYLGNSIIKQISGPDAQSLLHKWRSQEDAFMVGTNTLIHDNPRLSNRFSNGKNPIRVAIDYELKSNDMDLHFFDQSQRTIVFNGQKNTIEQGVEYIQIKDRLPQTIVHKLHELSIGSVVIEGGADILNSFLATELVDEIRVFKSKELQLKEGIKAPRLNRSYSKIDDLDTDLLYTYYIH